MATPFSTRLSTFPTPRPLLYLLLLVLLLLTAPARAGPDAQPDLSGLSQKIASLARRKHSSGSGDIYQASAQANANSAAYYSAGAAGQAYVGGVTAAREATPNRYNRFSDAGASATTLKGQSGNERVSAAGQSGRGTVSAANGDAKTIGLKLLQSKLSRNRDFSTINFPSNARSTLKYYALNNNNNANNNLDNDKNIQ
eukprot:g10034.t1